MTIHSLSRKQARAVRAVMRLLVEDDRARGIPPTARHRCDACGRQRPAAGSVAYPAGTLCNPCATRYELARLRHTVPPARDWLAGPSDGSSPAPKRLAA
jgi:hypothetical protein